MSDFSTEARTDPGARPSLPSRGDGSHLAPADRPPGAPAGISVGPGHATPTTARPPGYPSSAPMPAAVPPSRSPATEASSDVKGRIHIADEVVEKVAGLAAIEVDGVADLGGDFARAMESVRERIGLGAKRGDQGVKAEVKGHDVAVNVTIMVEFGYVVLDVARRVQANVAAKTARMLGLRVVEVNVNVDDVRTARAEPEGNGTADGDVA